MFFDLTIVFLSVFGASKIVSKLDLPTSVDAFGVYLCMFVFSVGMVLVGLEFGPVSIVCSFLCVGVGIAAFCTLIYYLYFDYRVEKQF